MSKGSEADGVERRRILYVEDDAFLAALVEATLADAGFDLEWYSCGELALAAAANEKFDLYLLDLKLPRMPGDELSRRLRALTPSVPIVFVSGDEELLGTLVSRSVVRKPFYENELLEAVAAALAGTRAATPA